MKDYRTLHRGLRALFWVEIIGLIGTFVASIATVAAAVAEVMRNPHFGNSLYQPDLSALNVLPIAVWSLVLALAYVIIHFYLGRTERRYTVTGVLLLLYGACSVPFSFSGTEFLLNQRPAVFLLLECAFFALSIAYFCMQIAAHRHALAGVDDKLAKHWRVLRILFLLAIPAVALIALLMALGARLENPMLLFTAVPLVFLILGGMIALCVLRYVYLYKTGTRFKRMIDQKEIEGTTNEE